MQVQNSKPGPRYDALLQLLRTAETLWNASRRFFARWNLSPSQFNILNLLHGSPSGRSQIELSRELIMHRSNVTGLVDRLEARGLVVRKDAPQDRRAHRVILTTEGMKLLHEILPHYYQAAEEVWDDLSVAKTAELLAELSRVSENANHIANSTPHPNDVNASSLQS